MFVIEELLSEVLSERERMDGIFGIRDGVFPWCLKLVIDGEVVFCVVVGRLQILAIEESVVMLKLVIGVGVGEREHSGRGDNRQSCAQAIYAKPVA